MDALEAIFTRRSIRKFNSTPVSDEDLKTLLRAAMVAPSSKNAQPWRFVVITERAILDTIPDIHAYAGMAKTATLAITVCIDSQEDPRGTYWEQDCSAAIQNILLAGRALNIGTVWCGLYPDQDRANAFIKLLNLPASVRPLGLVLAGHTDLEFTPKDRYDAEKIHYNKW